MNDQSHTAVITADKPSQTLGFFEQAAHTFEGVEKIAALMGKMATMPAHLQNKPADCFRIVVQAAKWRMDPFAVAECTSLVHGKMCYEGKLVAAVLTSMNAIEGRLEYEITGKGQNAKIKITGTPRGGKPVSLEGSVADWRTNGNGSPWDKQPEMQLIYRGTRQWARAYAPEAILGIYTPDEMEEKAVEATVVNEPKNALVRTVPGAVEPPASAVPPSSEPATAPAPGDGKTVGEHLAEAQKAETATAHDCVKVFSELWNHKNPKGRETAKALRTGWDLQQIADLDKDTEENRRKFIAQAKAALHEVNK